MQARSDALEPASARAWTGGTEDDRRFVYAVARRIVRDDAIASDVAQDAMLAAHRHQAGFRGDSHYRTWLYQIATRAALSSLRRERTWHKKLAAVLEHTAGGGELVTATVAPEASTALDDARDLAQVDAQLATLDDKYRRVFELRFRDGYSERETAAALGLSTATVKIRTFRARRMLRERLGV